jgi:peptide deformylase
MIITEKHKLQNKIEPSDLTNEQIDDISTKLLTELAKHGGLGLSANQIGLKDRVCLINVIDPIILVNPRIIETSNSTIAYAEQCLSLPKTMKSPVKTIRYKSITVECDNLGKVEFGPNKDQWASSAEFFSDQGLLESVCAQHEIDHLNGILITDSNRRYTTTRTVGKKYGRNERVMIKGPDGSTEFMKYKKAEQLIGLGYDIV